MLANKPFYHFCCFRCVNILSDHNDLVRAIDNRHISLLVLLDLSAAFDTIDHNILLSVLEHRFAIHGTALDWFRSYLTEGTQSFVFAGKQTTAYQVECSVPQGSVLGRPTRFCRVY